MEQWRLQLSTWLGINKKEIGRIGGGHNEATGKIDIAMVQSLDLEEGVDDRIADYGFIISDECHHAGAFSFEKVLGQAKAKNILGLTATPFRRDGRQPILHMQCGPICCLLKEKDLSTHISEGIVHARETKFSYTWDKDSKIHDLWDKMISNEARNNLIVKDVLEAVGQGRFPLILTERKEHLETLNNLLNGKVDSIFSLYGSLKRKLRNEIMEKLKDVSAAGTKLIIATGSYVGEGFDEPRLDAFFMTMPCSFKGRIIQYTGRLHRQCAGKQNIRIYDYVDKNVSVLENMYRKRLKTYKMLGYEVSEQRIINNSQSDLPEFNI